MTHENSTRDAVVVHAVDQETDIERALRVAAGLREAFPGIRVHIIVNGPALDGLPKLDRAPQQSEARISACAIGLGRRGIDPAALPDGVELVEASPAAIVGEQLAGAAYLRL